MSIINTDFINFRQQFQSLIYSVSSLNLTNVNFKRNQAVSGGSIITMACNSNCNSINFAYLSGTVSNLNDGYDDTASLSCGNFFTASGINSLYFSNITFSFNLVLSSSNSLYPAKLINIINHQGTITIINCIFDTNYVESLIYIDVSDLVYSDLKFDSSNISQSYNQIHLTLENTIFMNIYSSTDFITYTMRQVLHNIYIKSVTLTNIISAGNGIIYISNTNSLGDEYYNKINPITTLINGVESKYTIPNPLIKIDSLAVNSIITGLNFVAIINMLLITLNNLTITHTTDGNINDIENIITKFTNNGNYLSGIPISGTVADLYCKGIFMISDVMFTTISNINITDTMCMTSGNLGSIYIENASQNILLNNVMLNSMNAASFQSVAIAAINSTILNIASLSILNSINEKGPIMFLSVTNVYLNSINFVNDYSLASSGLYIQNVLNLVFNNFSFANVTSTFGNGACLYVSSVSTGSQMSASIENGIFHNCTKITGNGGGLFLDAASIYNIQLINIFNLTFSNCSAIDGSAIFISNNVVLADHSFFSNITVLGNFANISVISDNHNKGIFNMSSVNLFNNIGNYAGIKGNYVSSNQAIILNSVVMSEINSFLYLFSLNSIASGTLANFTSLYFPEVSPNAFANSIIAYGISLNMTDLKMTNCFTFDGLILDTATFPIEKCSSLAEANTQDISCLAERENQDICNQLTYYVIATPFPGYAQGIGSISDPFQSLHYAFTKVYAPYTNISLSPGTHYYNRLGNLPKPTPVIADFNDPLNLSTLVGFFQM